MSKEYSAKLKNPRWQKKRLMILDRDKWTCQQCQGQKESLVVHHRYYLPSTEPWDYPDEALVTLCESCHEIEREQMPSSEQQIIRALKAKFFAQDIYILANSLEKMRVDFDSIAITRSYAYALRDTDMQKLIVNSFFEQIDKGK